MMASYKEIGVEKDVALQPGGEPDLDNMEIVAKHI